MNPGEDGPEGALGRRIVDRQENDGGDVAQEKRCGDRPVEENLRLLEAPDCTGAGGQRAASQPLKGR